MKFCYRSYTGYKRTRCRENRYTWLYITWYIYDRWL